MTQKKIIKLALVDDHKLFRKGLRQLVEMLDDELQVILEADDGIDLKDKLKADDLPELVLMDINMPRMNGFETVKWLLELYPQIKVLVVSMIDSEESIIKMLKLGVKGYMSKDIEPPELLSAIHAIINQGYYYTDFITGRLVHALQNGDGDQQEKTILEKLSDREKEFLTLSCSDFTYAQIAEKMFLSPKTIDGYRAALFEKLEVKSRVAMALFCVKHKIVEL